MTNSLSLTDSLFKLQDTKYRELQIRTVPTVSPESVIGVRTPDLRAIAKEIRNTPMADEILNSTEHMYFEEKQIHAFLISLEKDINKCFDELESFFPQVDNWATCDQMIPNVFKRNHAALIPKVYEWFESDNIYEVRFAVKVLMDHFLDEDFDVKYPAKVAGITTDEYYLQMMAAWYFATALAKQYEAVIPYMEQHKLDPVVHKMTVRKACDSFRVSDEHKKYLRSL